MTTEEFQTTEEQAEPSYNPVAEESSAVAFDYMATNLIKQTNVCLPAIVEEYDRQKNVVTVQPAISEAITGDKFIERAKLKTPVLQLAGGGFMLSFPLKKGDTGWLIAADRDISLFKQQKTKINPNTYRAHSFEDAFFIPDFVSGHKEEKSNEENVVLRSIKGASEVIISEDKISVNVAKKDEKQGDKSESQENKEGQEESLKTKITIDLNAIQSCSKTHKAENEMAELTIKNEVKFKCPKITIEGACAVESNAAISIKSEKVSIEGNLEVSGEIKSSSVKSGTIEGDSVEAGGISLSSHVHGGVEAGGSTTGEPQ